MVRTSSSINFSSSPSRLLTCSFSLLNSCTDSIFFIAIGNIFQNNIRHRKPNPCISPDVKNDSGDQINSSCNQETQKGLTHCAADIKRKTCAEKNKHDYCSYCKYQNRSDS